MARPRSHRPSARKSSRSTLVFAVLIMSTFVILILLAFGILSVPSNNAGSSKANDLTSIVRKTLQRYDSIPIQYLISIYFFVASRSGLLSFFRRGVEDDSKNERWVEIISWEPRASVYHNFLVSLCLSIFTDLDYFSLRDMINVRNVLVYGNRELAVIVN